MSTWLHGVSQFIGLIPPAVESSFVNTPHTIRLRGPWRRGVEGAEGEVTDIDKAERTVKLPDVWTKDLGHEFQGRICYRRAFQRPLQWDDEVTAALVIQMIVGDARIWLNEVCLGTANWPDFPRRFEMTGQLQPRNQLRVEVTTITKQEMRMRGTQLPDVELMGEVQLEFD